jgi:hypothetical protein
MALANLHRGGLIPRRGSAHRAKALRGCIFIQGGINMHGLEGTNAACGAAWLRSTA